jgi:SAM-dependent methyltransferase
MIGATARAAVRNSLMPGLRRSLVAVRIWMIGAVNVIWFYLLHRKFVAAVDQRRYWEGRWKEDVAILPAVDEDPYYQRIDATMLARLGVMEGDVVLEIGSHTGYRLGKFARRVPERRFIGLDLGFANLAGGRQTLGTPLNVALVNANAAALPFADASIDIVYTCVSLTHMDYDTISKVMAEIGRVVRRHVLLWEVDERPMGWRNKLRVINIGYFFLHRYEKLVGPALKLLSITPMPDLVGHPRYTLFQFSKAP